MKIEKYNDNWKFWRDTNSFDLVQDVPDHAHIVNIPHDAMIALEPYAGSGNAGNTGFRDSQNYVYVKTFKATEADLEKRLTLKFEGSYMNTFVYVNGQLAGKHHFGYTTFYVPLQDFLKVGENEIRVQVRNGAMSNSRWYSGSGLYRDVYLLESNLLHIAQTGSRVKTISIDELDALIDVTVPVINEASKVQDFILETVITGPTGQVVLRDSRPYFVNVGDQVDYNQRFLISDAQLWTEQNPNLYKIENHLIVNGQVLDSEVSRFGIRTISVDSKNGLRINGQTVKLRGACIHHDSGLLGAATYEEAHRRQVKILKEAGFNAIRMSHHPSAPVLLRACDELGMYVMDETFDMWTHFKGDFDYSLTFMEQWRKDVTAMVESDFNHPSVILYSIGNEIPEIATLHGSRLAKEINDHIKAIDDSRPTLASINGVFASGDNIPQILGDIMAENASEGIEVEGNVNDFMTMMDSNLDNIVVHPIVSRNLEYATAATDIAGYNYMTARYENDSQNYPNRVMVGSETYPPEIARNWRIIEKLPSVIGDFTWTGWDYIGEAGVGIPSYTFGEGGFEAQFPCQLAYVGDIDITGFRRPQSYYREIVFGLRKEPYIAIQNPHHYGDKLIKTPWVLSDTVSSWSWDINEGSSIRVEVYAPGDEVALYLNDQLIEKKAVGAVLGCVTYFETIYEPGVLKAVNYEKGQIIAESTLVTADSNSEKITLFVEESQDNLLYINLTLTDEKGVVINDADRLAVIELEGAELLGFGSGNPKPLEHYQSSQATTFNGRALAIVRKTAKKASMTARAEDLVTSVTF